ncbi:uncharacterized protein LOC127859823 isoform X2 [Dreissena polymorpha]|uniref:UBZ1-type domain-containing protein n=2 Tax=Dreissena polymorpha TaxID=45954 RepID=A0A9D3YM52_DREPO|nr:uncharacterized protein LOC127859823 isoform X2 [Dreissena polymorpha]XP_052253292.1 uncharacterized protein LOC127859823 isoform X2 [Dreissena polymorpha]XP_052253293.1 uncharacterized protein LOC127859823 isoform X2 [Dreissena polymorpha]KAH3703107.1 hypothetical protein DPMN_078136 [Dreissena polymorpha]
MDDSSDEDIELLNATEGYLKEDDKNTNPLYLLQRSDSSQNSISSGSLHALQTACGALQKKLKERDKKIYELTQKMNTQEYKRGVNVMEECYNEEPLSAAGATSGDETSLAVRGANEGLIRHLQREVLMRDNALQKHNEENYRLRYEKEEMEKRFLLEKDRLEGVMQELDKQCGGQDAEIAHFKNILQSMEQENCDLKEKLLVLQRNSQLSTVSQSQVQELRNKCSMLENEKRNLLTDFESLRTEKLALEAKCKQLEIEAKINWNNHQARKQSEETDDVDGDISILQQALQLVHTQREEQANLKKKVQDQNAIIKQITSSYKVPNRPYCSDPQFAAHNPFPENSYSYNRLPPPSGYGSGQSHSEAVLRRQSTNTSDFSRAKTNPVARVAGVSGTVVSSNAHVPQMFAMETSQPKLSANMVDSIVSPRSPAPCRPKTNNAPLSPTMKHNGTYYKVEVVENASNQNGQTLNKFGGQASSSSAVVASVHPLQASNQVNNLDQMRRSSSQERRSQYSPVGVELNQRLSTTNGYFNAASNNLNPSTGNDYENVYNVKAQREVKRQIEEHEEPRFVTCNTEDSAQSNAVAEVKICPSCNQEFSRLTMADFQVHVFDCFDQQDESPATLQAMGNDDDRTCPMCNDTFPSSISQEQYEQHVLAHFGEDPHIDNFEIVH